MITYSPLYTCWTIQTCHLDILMKFQENLWRKTSLKLKIVKPKTLHHKNQNTDNAKFFHLLIFPFMYFTNFPKEHLFNLIGRLFREMLSKHSWIFSKLKGKFQIYLSIFRESHDPMIPEKMSKRKDRVKLTFRSLNRWRNPDVFRSDREVVFWVAFDDNHAVLGSVGHQTTGVGASGKGQALFCIRERTSADVATK